MPHIFDSRLGVLTLKVGHSETGHQLSVSVFHRPPLCLLQAEEMKKRLYRLDRIEKGLQNFLYEDQIRALSLTKRSRRAVWSPETILKAQKIRSAVGTKGYEYLRELGYPLPSYRTLCNRLETKIMVTTDMSCEMLAELGLGLMAPCDSPTEVVGDNDEEELMGVLS